MKNRDEALVVIGPPFLPNIVKAIRTLGPETARPAAEEAFWSALRDAMSPARLSGQDFSMSTEDILDGYVLAAYRDAGCVTGLREATEDECPISEDREGFGVVLTVEWD